MILFRFFLMEHTIWIKWASRSKACRHSVSYTRIWSKWYRFQTAQYLRIHWLQMTQTLWNKTLKRRKNTVFCILHIYKATNNNSIWFTAHFPLICICNFIEAFFFSLIVVRFTCFLWFSVLCSHYIATQSNNNNQCKLLEVLSMCLATLIRNQIMSRPMAGWVSKWLQQFAVEFLLERETEIVEETMMSSAYCLLHRLFIVSYDWHAHVLKNVFHSA